MQFKLDSPSGSNISDAMESLKLYIYPRQLNFDQKKNSI